MEPLLMVCLILGYIWKLRYTHPYFWIAIPVLMIFSHLIRGEGFRALGFKVHGLWHYLKILAPAPILMMLLAVAAGAWLHTLRPLGFDGVLLSLGAYLPWGLAQEYALNGYILNRFDRALSEGAASILAAVLFAVVHAPNPFMMAVTLPLGWYATIVYRRTRNLYVLGIGHALIGLTLFIVVPDWVSHHLRVGPGWFRP
jgi:membrane protease YdiL (CAAX protease family)